MIVSCRHRKQMIIQRLRNAQNILLFSSPTCSKMLHKRNLMRTQTLNSMGSMSVSVICVLCVRSMFSCMHLFLDLGYVRAHTHSLEGTVVWINVSPKMMYALLVSLSFSHSHSLIFCRFASMAVCLRPQS